MNTDEINAQIAQIDRRLASENKSLADRINLVKSELCPDVDDLTERFLNNGFPALNNEEFNRLTTTLPVDNWYRANYGSKTTPNFLNIKETPFFLQGEIWYFTHSKEIEYWTDLGKTNLPEIVKQNLNNGEVDYFKKQCQGRSEQLQKLKYLEDVVFFRNKKRKNDKYTPILTRDELNNTNQIHPVLIPDRLKNNFYLSDETINFLRFALEDLNLAIVTLKNTRDYQFVVFPASQAIEKLLKACLIEEELQYTKNTSEAIRHELKTQYGHKLFYILQKLECYLEFASKIVNEVEKIPHSREFFIKNPTKNPRYDDIEISSEEAVKIIDATLNIFGLVSDKLFPPLSQVLPDYYPELQEYYPEREAYYDQLEDDDYYFDE